MGCPPIARTPQLRSASVLQSRPSVSPGTCHPNALSLRASGWPPRGARQTPLAPGRVGVARLPLSLPEPGAATARSAHARAPAVPGRVCRELGGAPAARRPRPRLAPASPAPGAAGSVLPGASCALAKTPLRLRCWSHTRGATRSPRQGFTLPRPGRTASLELRCSHAARLSLPPRERVQAAVPGPSRPDGPGERQQSVGSLGLADAGRQRLRSLPFRPGSPDPPDRRQCLVQVRGVFRLTGDHTAKAELVAAFADDAGFILSGMKMFFWFLIYSLFLFLCFFLESIWNFVLLMA